LRFARSSHYEGLRSRINQRVHTGKGKTRALAGVNLEVRDCEFFGIIGPTGCGK